MIRTLLASAVLVLAALPGRTAALIVDTDVSDDIVSGSRVAIGNPSVVNGSDSLPLSMPPVASAMMTNQIVNADIPDNSTTGLASVQDVSLGFNQIGQVTVQLKMGNASNGDTPWNGDFYAYLEHGGKIAVLLNRVGRAANLPGDAGYGGTGFDITLQDGTSDIHTYEMVTGTMSGPLTGTWAPDGRSSAPGFGITSDPVDSSLGVFNGSDPNGAWRLVIVDLATGNQGQLESWSLTITPVPEPSTAALTAAAASLGFLLRRNRVGPASRARIYGFGGGKFFASNSAASRWASANSGRSTALCNSGSSPGWA